MICVFGTGLLNCVDDNFQCGPIDDHHYPVIYGFSSIVFLTYFQSDIKLNLYKIIWAEWGREMIKRWNEDDLSPKMNNLSEFVDCIVTFTKNFAKLKISTFNSMVHKAFWLEECSRAVSAVSTEKKSYENFYEPSFSLEQN